MRKVVDSNLLQSPELQSYLSESTNNHAVLTDYAAMEAYKGNTLESIYKSMAILANYPKQVVVLKDTQTVCGLKLMRSDFEIELIDESQTRDFGTYCQILFASKQDDKSSQRQVLEYGRRADEQMERLLRDASGLSSAIDAISKLYTESELRILRTGSAYSAGMIDKLFTNVLYVAGTLFKNHPKTQGLPDRATLPNTFIFRSALCGYLLALNWIAVGGAKGVSVPKLRNDLVDINFAAFGTYFDGLLSADKKITGIYQDAAFLLLKFGDAFKK